MRMVPSKGLMLVGVALALVVSSFTGAANAARIVEDAHAFPRLSGTKADRLNIDVRQISPGTTVLRLARAEIGSDWIKNRWAVTQTIPTEDFVMLGPTVRAKLNTTVKTHEGTRRLSVTFEPTRQPVRWGHNGDTTWSAVYMKVRGTFGSRTVSTNDGWADWTIDR